MKNIRFTFLLVIFFLVSQSAAFTYHWKIDETPEGSESSTVVEPVQVTLIDEPMEVVSHNASLALMQKYSGPLGPEWSPRHASYSKALNLSYAKWLS